MHTVLYLLLANRTQIVDTPLFKVATVHGYESNMSTTVQLMGNALMTFKDAFKYQQDGLDRHIDRHKHGKHCGLPQPIIKQQ